MTIKNITICPGSMEVIGQALDKFGEDRVITGAWNEPVRVHNLTMEEAAFARKFFCNMGCRVIEEHRNTSSKHPSTAKIVSSAGK